VIIHDLADTFDSLIGRAVLTVGATAGAATALLVGGLALLIHRKASR
jgi:hypothetical protein